MFWGHVTGLAFALGIAKTDAVHTDRQQEATVPWTTSTSHKARLANPHNE